MKNIILAAVATFAFIAPSFAMEAAPAVAAKAEHCVCGKAADAKVDAVAIKVGDADKKIAVCSKECAEAVKKMKPEEAAKAAEAQNKAK